MTTNTEKLSRYVARLERLIGMSLPIPIGEKVRRIKGGVRWFSVEARPVNGTICDSMEYNELERIAKQYKKFRIEPGRWGRIVIYALDWEEV